MKISRNEYRKNRTLLLSKGYDLGIKYKAYNGTEVKEFHSAAELADFLGYAPDYAINLVKQHKIIVGWKIIRYKWFEHLEDFQ